MNLAQSTGEDWKDAKLVLSTSETDVLNAGIPKSVGLVVEPKLKLPPPPQPPLTTGARGAPRSRKFKAKKIKATDETEESQFGLDYNEEEEFFDFCYMLAAPPVMSEGGAVVSKSPMAVNYTVGELTTIPSDDKIHKVLVATIPLEASISHVTTPRKSPFAYLQVRVVVRLVCNLPERTPASSVLSKTQAIIISFPGRLTSSSTTRMSPKRRCLTLGLGTPSTALSEWTHRSKS